MQPVRYRPGESLKWLDEAAGADKKKAGRLYQSAVHDSFSGSAAEASRHRLMKAAKAMGALLKGAYTEIANSKMLAVEYVLTDDSIFISGPNRREEIRFDTISSLTFDGVNAVFNHQKGDFTIKPYAYITAGAVKAPIGWNRDGHEVPYELLVEEIAARCGLQPPKSRS